MIMQIQWLAHAAFLLQGESLRIITDPFEPNEIINLPAIELECDLVIRSSDDDEAHAYLGSLPPGFDVVTATDIVGKGATVRGLRIDALGAKES